MAWTYDKNFPEISKNLTKDPSTPGRFTFERKMYFKPDSYDAWATGKSYNSTDFSAGILGNSSLPKIGDYLTGSLSNFYLVDYQDISNLNEDEDGEAVSYGVVTLLYENKRAKGSGSSNSNAANQKKPWEREVDDFTITNQEVSIPFTQGYLNKTLTDVQTTAGQKIYDFSTSNWISRCTWTYYDKSKDFFIKAPVINDNDVTLFGKVTITAGCGLLLPPSYRKLIWTDEKGNESDYQEWQFEIIVNSLGHTIPIINAGTIALDANGSQYDICEWYVTDPVAQTYQRFFGTFAEMMTAKNTVDNENFKQSDPMLQKTWTGDFVQNPVPIGEDGKLSLAGNNIIRLYEQYKRGSWNLGTR